MFSEHKQIRINLIHHESQKTGEKEVKNSFKCPVTQVKTLKVAPGAASKIKLTGYEVLLENEGVACKNILKILVHKQKGLPKQNCEVKNKYLDTSNPLLIGNLSNNRGMETKS